jgi:hypothetical protein
MKRHIAQLIDDQQLDYVEMFLQCAQAALIACFHEFVRKGGRGREGDKARQGERVDSDGRRAIKTPKMQGMAAFGIQRARENIPPT